MGILKTKGIIIAENNMNDFDKMLTILTPNGKIGVLPKEQEDQKVCLWQQLNFCALENICCIIIRKITI